MTLCNDEGRRKNANGEKGNEEEPAVRRYAKIHEVHDSHYDDPENGPTQKRKDEESHILSVFGIRKKESKYNTTSGCDRCK